MGFSLKDIMEEKGEPSDYNIAPLPGMRSSGLHVGIYVGRVPDSREFLRNFFVQDSESP